MANKFKFKMDRRKSWRGFGEKPFFRMRSVPSRLRQSINLMSSMEKTLVGLLITAAFLMSSFEARKVFYNLTKSAPSYSGVYKEGISGSIKYLNPILASTENDKAISSLIFSGLIKFDKDNNIIPDVAKDWQISEDKKTYTFNLKENVFFHDNKQMTSEDVVYTIEKIKATGETSPLYNSWKDVEVDAPSATVVNFILPKPYGPFIYNCGFGILPAHIIDEEMNKKPIGSGKLKFESVKKEKSLIVKVLLERNENFYEKKPFIKNVQFIEVENSQRSQEEALKTGKIDAIITNGTLNNFKNIYFSEQKKLGLVINVKDDKLKDKNLRQKILSGEKVDPAMDISLDTIDSELQRSKAESLKKDFANQNINLKINYHNSVEMLDVLSQKKYQFLLYGFDFGKDSDPYLFWHSTQVGKLNFANWSNKDTDIILEDARMMTDKAQRQSKYTEFYNLIEKEFVAKYYDVTASAFTVNNRVLGVGDAFGSDLFSRYNNFENWYVEERRVRK